MKRVVGGQHGEDGPLVETRTHDRADWPHRDIVVNFPPSIAMRPNHVRRLIRVLEAAIVEAEAER